MKLTVQECMHIITALENKLHQVTICLIIDRHIYIYMMSSTHQRNCKQVKASV